MTASVFWGLAPAEAAEWGEEAAALAAQAAVLCAAAETAGDWLGAIAASLVEVAP